MKRYLAAALLLAAAATGCTNYSATDSDLEGVPPTDPDKVEAVRNINGHPNMVRLCIDGVAVLTSSREYDAITRVPEWDTWCDE